MELNKKRESEVFDNLPVDNPFKLRPTLFNFTIHKLLTKKLRHFYIFFFSQKVTKLRKDLEECRIQHDATLVSLKKKQADSIAEVIFIYFHDSWISV